MAIIINRKPNYGTAIGGMGRGPAPLPRVEIEKRDQKIAQLETDISALHADRKARRIDNLEKSNATLNAEVAGLKDQLATAELVQQGNEGHIATLTGKVRSLEEEKAILLRKMDGLIDGFTGSDLLERKVRVVTDPEPINPANLNRELQEPAKEIRPNSLLPDGGEEFRVSSPDDFIVKVSTEFRII